MGPPEPITSVRKSGRTRQPNKRYSADTFAGLDILSSASEEEVEVWKQLEASDNDEDFDEAKAVEEAIEAEEDEISSAGAISDGSGIATPAELSDDAIDADCAEERDLPLANHSKSRLHSSREKRVQDVGTHTRGIADPVAAKARGSKSDYLYSLFGDTTRDLVHMARSRDQWCDAATLPRRPNESGSRGMRHLFSYTEEKRYMEATVGWDWYYQHGGRQYLESIQQSHPLSRSEANKLIPQPSHSHRTLFMGPYGRQTRFDLQFLQSMPLCEAWHRAPHPQIDGTNGPGRPKSKPAREGWLFNVGTGIRCLDWAPNHSGDTQYLALSTFQPKSNEKFGQSKFSPAFTPQSFPSSIQIWSFSSSEAADRKSLLDPETPPLLRLVIGFDWGDAKHLTWCPMPRIFREEERKGKVPVGLLAGVWSDGHVRVIDVQLGNMESQETQY
ncbi:MAG: hypothetical protein Q9218_007261, partial [Villophora microphyllina]